MEGACVVGGAAAAVAQQQLQHCDGNAVQVCEHRRKCAHTTRCVRSVARGCGVSAAQKEQQ